MSGDFCHVIVDVCSLELQLGLCVHFAMTCLGLGNKMVGLVSKTEQTPQTAEMQSFKKLFYRFLLVYGAVFTLAGGTTSESLWPFGTVERVACLWPLWKELEYHTHTHWSVALSTLRWLEQIVIGHGWWSECFAGMDIGPFYRHFFQFVKAGQGKCICFTDLIHI